MDNAMELAEKWVTADLEAEKRKEVPQETEEDRKYRLDCLDRLKQDREKMGTLEPEDLADILEQWEYLRPNMVARLEKEGRLLIMAELLYNRACKNQTEVAKQKNLDPQERMQRMADAESCLLLYPEEE